MRYWIAFAVLAALLYAVRSILPPFVIALVLAYVFVPGIDFLSRRFHWPRGLVVLVLYIIFIAVVGAAIYAVEPSLAREAGELTRDAPGLVRNLFVQTLGGEEVSLFGQTVRADQVAAQVLRSLQENSIGPEGALRIAESVLHGIFQFLLFLIVLFYLLKDWDKLAAAALSMLPLHARPRVRDLALSIHIILGRYVRGQLILVVLMSAVTWVVLRFVFNLRFALPIAIATGLLEIVPLAGPALAATIAAIVAFSQGGGHFALIVIVFYTIARHLEDYLVVPTVVGRAVHLHPVVSIFAVLAGGALAGILGTILAIPAAAALVVIWDVVRADVNPPHSDSVSPEPPARA
jgi:predicted PurR-regulated permease PerM